MGWSFSRLGSLFGCFAALVALAPLSGCQGALNLNDGVARPPADMTMVMNNDIPAMLGFADIYRDMDTPPGLGCTNQISACHGGTTPTGKMALLDMSSGDMAKLMTSYAQVQMRVTTSDPANSLLLLKMLSSSAGGVTHTGGTYFQDKNNAMYKRWLKWIELGAPFEETSTTGGGSTVDMAGGGG